MLKRWLEDSRLRCTLALVFAIVISITVLSPAFSNPKLHSRSLAVIKSCKEQATGLTLTLTLVSTAITLLPEDTGSAIADELSELSTPLLIIVCILYFEQYLLTSMEALAFGILLPLAFLFFIGSIYLQKNSLRVIGYKILLIALVCAVAFPTSAGLTIMIRETFAETINMLQTQLDDIVTVFSDMLNADDVLKFLSSFASGIGEILKFAKDALGLLIDAVAILLITSCVIPVITVLLFIWCIKSIIAGKLDNLEDTTMSVLKKLSLQKKNLPQQNEPDDSMKLPA